MYTFVLFLENWGYVCLAVAACVYVMYRRLDDYIYKRSVDDATFGTRAKMLDKRRQDIRFKQQVAADEHARLHPPPKKKKRAPRPKDVWSQTSGRLNPSTERTIHVVQRHRPPPPCAGGG